MKQDIEEIKEILKNMQTYISVLQHVFDNKGE